MKQYANGSTKDDSMEALMTYNLIAVKQTNSCNIYLFQLDGNARGNVKKP